MTFGTRVEKDFPKEAVVFAQHALGYFQMAFECRARGILMFHHRSEGESRYESDDLLDFIVIADVPKIIALAILPTVFSGKHTRLPGVHIFRCKKAEVHSKIALPVHSDGEPIYLQKDVSFSLEPETLKIIT